MSRKADERVAEQHRVDNIMREIKKKIAVLYQKSQGLKESVITLRKNFWEDVTVNLDEPDDVIETQASIKQQAELLSDKERGHGQLDDQLKTLSKLKESPYFGRIDFLEDQESREDHIYIGVASMMDKEDENFLIYDWRAPISSMYYDFSPGEAFYETVEGTITGEVTLKRQFIIKNGYLSGMFDTGVTIGDKLLQQALGNNASTSMKSIVATIQKEQNQIIRNETSKYLIVQGVAGSGKTSAALQRIAYLMYRYREELSGENIILFSPNPLFASYVAKVLPELGEENMRQTTFLDYLEAKIESHISIESPFKQMESVLTGESDSNYAIKMESINYKSSIEFKDVIDDFVSSLGQTGLLFKNITFRKQVLVSKEQISSYFYSLDQSIAIPNRMELVSKWLLKEISKIQKQEQKEDWVLDEIELLDKEDFLRAHRYVEGNSEEHDSIIEENYLRKELVKKRFASIKKQIRKMGFIHILATYRNLFSAWEFSKQPGLWDEICVQTFTDLSNKFLPWEDATPFVYFQGLLIGDTADRSIRHLFIDEAQDYSAFQYAYFQQVFPYTKMTLLGDLNQGIYQNATQEYAFLPKEIREKYESISLNQSYRSTKQIVEFTRCFATGGKEIQPFNRDGEKPVLIEVESSTKRNEQLIKMVNKLIGEDHETIAVICKTLKESKSLFHILSEEMPVKLIDEDTHTFQKGILILPVYWAKGIEFDAVIIPDASHQQYAGESSRNLFYTACTRAMHELIMFTKNEPCAFINEAPVEKYKSLHA